MRRPAQSASQEVADNLGRVFNTRRGCGSVVDEFGLGEYEHSANTHDAVVALLQELPALVGRYEPRLQEPVVELEGRYGYRKVRFGLSGRIDGAACAFIVDIDTTTRRVDVWPEEGG